MKKKKNGIILPGKKLSPLLLGITSKHKGEFYCLNCLHSFRAENKLGFYEKVCKNKDFCEIVMPSEEDKILEFNQYMNSDKMPLLPYYGNNLGI